MRSFVWLTLGLIGFLLGYSTRSDQGFSMVRLVGFALLAVGSIGLLPRYPLEDPAPDAAEPQPARRRSAPEPAGASMGSGTAVQRSLQ
jgi:hypothetical protein